MTCLKKTVGLFGFLIMAGGIFLIVWTSIKLSNKEYDLFSQAGFDWGEALTIITLIVGCLLFILGIFGIYGGCKRNKCCLCIYTPGIFILGAVVLGIAIMSSIVFVQYNSELEDLYDSYQDNCQGANFNNPGCQQKFCGYGSDHFGWLASLNDNVNSAGSQFGSSNCAIYVDNAVNGLQPQITNYIDQVLDETPQVTNDPSKGYINIQKCKNLTNEYGILDISALLVFFETNFQCSGICQPYPYYIFSNVNESPFIPSSDYKTNFGSPCFSKIVDFWSNYSVQIQVITYIVGSVILINVILVLVLCCKKEKKERNIYTNMDYLD